MLFWNDNIRKRWGFYHNNNVEHRLWFNYIMKSNPTLGKSVPNDICVKCGKPKTKNHRC